MKKTLFLLFALVLPYMGIAQLEFGPRYEQLHSNQTLDYKVIPNGSHGVLILQKENAQAWRNPLVIKHLDINMNLQWEDTVNIQHPFFVKGYHYTQNNTYLLLWNPSSHFVRILRINTAQRTIDEFESQEILDLDILKFEVIKNTALIGGMFDEKPTVLAYDFEKSSLKTLQNVYQNRSKLLDIKINQDSITFNILVSAPTKNKDRTIVVNTYDFEGNAIRDYKLDVKPGYLLVDGLISSINDISQVVVGQYALGTASNIAGIYINYIDRTGKQTMTYHNFGTLPRYLDYKGTKRAKKLKEKAVAKLTENKEPIHNTRLRLREMREQDGKLIITGSSYQQTEFSHTYTLVIDQKGKILWDDYLGKKETITSWPVARGRFQWIGEEKGAYLYYHQRNLYLKIMEKSERNELLVAPLALKNIADELRYERNETVGTENWYDNHFINYGVQHLRPKDKSERVRIVFFVNKVSVSDKPSASALKN